MSAVLSAAKPVATDPEGVERTLRVQLAAAYRLVEHFGWSELIYGHLTVRLPGETRRRGRRRGRRLRPSRVPDRPAERAGRRR